MMGWRWRSNNLFWARVDISSNHDFRSASVPLAPKKTGRLKPRLYKQNPDGSRVEDKGGENYVILFSLALRGHRLCRRGFNRTSDLQYNSD